MVASLGDAKLPESGKKAIARCVEQHLRGLQELFPSDLSKEGTEWVRQIVQITQQSKRVRSRQDETLLPVVILDAGFASEKNIFTLEEKGYSYLVNVTRGSRKKFAEYFNKEDFKVLPSR